jgi:hypothetical protein
MCFQFLVEVPNIKFHGNPFSDSRAVTRRQTDRHGKASRHIFAIFHYEWTKNVKYFCSLQNKSFETFRHFREFSLELHNSPRDRATYHYQKSKVGRLQRVELCSASKVFCIVGASNYWSVLQWSQQH